MHPFCGGPTILDSGFSDFLKEIHGAFGGSGCCRSSNSGPGAQFASAFAGSFLNGRRIDFHATKEAYFAYVNAAGLERGDLKIQLSEGRLAVLKKGGACGPGSSTDPPTQEWIKLGSFELPDDAITDSLYARLADGELFISIQRIPQAEPEVFEVPIEIGAPAETSGEADKAETDPKGDLKDAN